MTVSETMGGNGSASLLFGPEPGRVTMRSGNTTERLSLMLCRRSRQAACTSGALSTGSKETTNASTAFLMSKPRVCKACS